MNTLSSIFRRLSLISATFVLGSCSLFLTGGNVFADDSTPCVPPANSQNGVHWPVGADAGTFTYQCDGPYAGSWTNAYYTYDPVTTQRRALYAPDYSYDCTNNSWMMTEWDYSPASHSYIQSRVVSPSTPALSTGCSAPAAPAAAAASSTDSSPNGITNTGPRSNNDAEATGTVNSTAANTANLNMQNTTSSTASSGNSLVIGNTAAGDASSGDTQSITNVANLLQSSTNVFGAGAVTFTANINGDVTGDFMFDPAAILASGPGSSNSVASNVQVNQNNSNDTAAQITNTIDTSAASGDATVANNTSGGNATSGNAAAVVNLMNLINSTVAAGQSFIGTININGNLNGDILLPQNVLDQLLASTGPGSSNSTSANSTSATTVANNITEAVVNNVASSALSGNATVANNTTAGTATTGNAGTNVTLLNLTGSNTIGKNDLLVFVNVSGQWVGMIMNAPSGSTAADLGGGITTSGPNSNNSTQATVLDTSNTTNNAALGITNNVVAHATTGDATVANNTSGGNATSGNAHTAVNILNLMGSNISLSDWFGVLFINVFGTWNGSFGVNTSAGDPVVASTQNPVQVAVHQTAAQSPKQFASFVSRNTVKTSGLGSSNTTQSAPQGVLGSMILASQKTPIAASHIAKPTVDKATRPSYLLLIGGVSASILILLASERERLFGRSH